MSHNVLDPQIAAAIPAGAPLDIDYIADLVGQATTNNWFDFRPDLLTLNAGNSNRISSAANRKPGGGGGPATQSTAGSQPAVSAAALDGHPAMICERLVGQLPRRLNHVFPCGSGISWTKLFVFWDTDGATTTAQGALWGSAGNGVGAHRVHRNTSNIIHRCGGSATEALVQVACNWVLPHFGAFSWDAPTGTAGLSLDGLPFATITNAGAVVTDTVVSIGALPNDGSGAGWNGLCFFADTDSRALHLTDSTTAAKWTLWKSFVRDNFPSLTIA